MIRTDKTALFQPLLGGLALLLVCHSPVCGGSNRPLSASKYDPDAPVIELFDGLEAGTIESKLVAHDATGGHLFLKNTTSEPLTVKMPQGFVAVPVHLQFAGPGNGFLTGTGPNATSQIGGNNQNGFNGRQAIGAGTTSSQGPVNSNPFAGNQGNPGFPQGFFSIPAERTLRVAYRSVCLNHGLLDPGPRVPYRLMKIEDYTSDPALQTIINRISDEEISQKALQAAAWHIANGMTWQELAAKGHGPVPGPGHRFFSASNIRDARNLVTQGPAIGPVAQQQQPVHPVRLHTIPTRLPE